MVAEHHELAARAAHLQRLETLEAANAVVLVDHEVPDAQVAEVREEAPQPARAPARVQADLLGEDVAVREDTQAAVGKLEARGERPHAHVDGPALAHGEPVLEEDVLEALGAPEVAEQDHAAALLATQIRGQAP